MKKIKLILFSLCLIFVNICVYGMNNVDSLYYSLMEQALKDFDSAKTLSEIIESKYKFERISRIAPQEWLPTYYITYSTLRYVYNNSNDSENNKLYLEEAKKHIGQLTKNAHADQSEIKTLLGYYYAALILLDPKANGKKYSKEVLRSYKDALKINPENPRAIILLAFFEQRLPKFMKSKRNPKTEVAKAKELFDKEEKNIHAPYWGRNYLNYVKLE